MANETKRVTYIGPKDPNEVTTVYRLPGDPGEDDLVLTRGIPADATPAQIRALKKDKAHRFSEGEAEVSETEGAPWTDYGDLSAEDVVARIGDPELTPSADFARSVVDWENAHDKRKTVVEAAEHQAKAYDPQAEGEGS